MTRGDFKLGDWTVRPQRDCIERGDESVHLKPKAMAVLLCLARAGGDVVPRQRLFDEVWPNSDVSDAVLTQCVVELRHAMGDDAHHPRYIETVPRVGFRLVPPLSTAENEVSTSPTALRRWFWAIGGGLFLLAVAAIAVILPLKPNSDDPVILLPPEPAVRSIVVLPFVDTSPDQDQGWLADGLSAELIARLTRIHDLRVIGQTSSFALKGKNVDNRFIVDSLGANYALDGSVAVMDERIHVTAKLVDARSGFNLWSESFERSETDLFEVQSEIIEAVALALSVRLGLGEVGAIPGGTNNVEAFKLLSRAWKRYPRFTSESMLQSIEFAKQAVAIDPDYARAWLDLAIIYSTARFAADPRLAVDWKELSRQALAEARRIAPELPEILATEIGLLIQERNWIRAQELIDETHLDAGQLDVDLDLAFEQGLLLTHVGRVSEAIPVIEHVHLLDPLRDHVTSVLGFLYLFSGRTSEALEEFEALWLMEWAPKPLTAWGGIIVALNTSDADVLTRWMERCHEIDAQSKEENLAGLFDEALSDPETAHDSLRRRFDESDRWDYGIILLAAYLGDDELALSALTRTPDSWTFWNPLLAELRKRPEFRQLARDLGLENYWRRYGWPDFCQPLGPKDFECAPKTPTTPERPVISR